MWKAKLEVQDAQRQHIMTINGPCCPCSCGSDVEFPVSCSCQRNNPIIEMMLKLCLPLIIFTVDLTEGTLFISSNGMFT